MSKKIKNEELKNVSGGASTTYNFTCENPECKKQFKPSDAVQKDGKIYCPHCGAYFDDLMNLDW